MPARRTTRRRGISRWRVRLRSSRGCVTDKRECVRRPDGAFPPPTLRLFNSSGSGGGPCRENRPPIKLPMRQYSGVEGLAMIDRLILPGKATLCAGLFAGILGLQPAVAATHEQIIEMCKQSLFAQIHACVVGKLGGPPRNAPADALERARQQCAPPLVRPCVMREEQKQAAGKAAPEAPKPDADTAPADASAVQPAFVAPPRTIADITAILDSEKPDAAKDAQRKAAAEAAPPANAPPVKLAQFYYDRG